MTITYRDLIDQVVDYLGGDPQAVTLRKARVAVQAAYRELAKGHRWQYYLRTGRITTVAPYSTGTVTYDHTGGAYERLVTLSGGSWPAWAADGVLQIGTARYNVQTVVSNTLLTLEPASNPGSDMASSSYKIYQEEYVLPVGFQEAGSMIIEDSSYILQYVAASSLTEYYRSNTGPAQPYLYAFVGSPNYMGAMCARLWPPPDNVYNLVYLYKSYPRPMKIEQVSAGLVSGSAGSDVITGSGTNFSSDMVGSVLRLSSGKTTVPTGLWGDSPYAEERIILAVSDSTHLTVDQTLSASYSSVKYSISDPADIDEDCMLALLQRECERQARIITRMKGTPEEVQAYQLAQQVAWAADNRSSQPASPRGSGPLPIRMAQMPYTPPSS